MRHQTEPQSWVKHDDALGYHLPHAIICLALAIRVPRHIMRANTTQKAYDEAFLACSTAVYFESQVGIPLIDGVEELLK